MIYIHIYGPKLRTMFEIDNPQHRFAIRHYFFSRSNSAIIDTSGRIGRAEQGRRPSSSSSSWILISKTGPDSFRKVTRTKSSTRAKDSRGWEREIIASIVSLRHSPSPHPRKRTSEKCTTSRNKHRWSRSKDREHR